MKGSGVSTQASVGGRVSGGSRGPVSKGVGVSLSLEARSGYMKSSSLTSRDRGMMVNKASFYGLDKNKGMFDKARPIRQARQQPSYEYQTPQGKNMLDRNRGKETRPKFARATTLETNKPIVNKTAIEKAIRRHKEKVKARSKTDVITPAVLEKRQKEQHTPHKTVAARTREVHFNPQVRSERVRTIKNGEVIFWKNGGREGVAKDRLQTAVVREAQKTQKVLQETRVKLATLIKESQKKVPEMRVAARQPIESQQPKNTMLKKTIEMAQQKTKQEARHKAVAPPAEKPAFADVLKQVIHVDPKSTYALEVRTAIQDAAEALPRILKDNPTMTEPQVQVFILNALSSRFQGKEGVSAKRIAHVLMTMRAEVSSKTQTEQAKDEEEENVQKTKIRGEMAKERMAVLVDRVKLYFKKDTKTNEMRVKTIMDIVRARLRSTGLTTGEEISHEASLRMGEKSAISEVAQPAERDGTVEQLISELRAYGEIQDEHTVYEQVKKDAQVHTAVMLTRDSSENTAKGLDAEKVYNGAVIDVPAYYGEEKMFGTLSAKKETRELVFINQQVAGKIPPQRA